MRVSAVERTCTYPNLRPGSFNAALKVKALGHVVGAKVTRRIRYNGSGGTEKRRPGGRGARCRPGGPRNSWREAEIIPTWNGQRDTQSEKEREREERWTRHSPNTGHTREILERAVRGRVSLARRTRLTRKLNGIRLWYL